MMNASLHYILLLLLLPISGYAQRTAVLFGASGTVGSEVLKAVVGGSSFTELIVIGRKASPKVDDILAISDVGNLNVTQLNLPDMHNQLQSYDKIEKADACFIAVGMGDINSVTLKEWHSVEIDLIGSIASFCNKIQVHTIALLSAVDVEYEGVTASRVTSGVKPFTEDEIQANSQKPLGWIKGISFYYRMKGLEERVVIENAKDVPHIRLFRPSSLRTPFYRYGLVDRILFPLHDLLDPYIPTVYHSVDVRLLGMAFVADAEEVLHHSVDKQQNGNVAVAGLTYADYLRVAGDAFEKLYGRGASEEL